MPEPYKALEGVYYLCIICPVDLRLFLTLKIKLPVVLPTKIHFFRNSTELQFKTHTLQENHRQVARWRTGMLFCREKEGAGEGYYKQKVPWSKLTVHSIVGFHCLTCDSLSLAELLPGEEETLPPPAGIVECVPVWARSGSSYWSWLTRRGRA